MSLEIAINELNASVRTLALLNEQLIEKLAGQPSAAFSGEATAAVEVAESASAAATEAATEAKRKRRTKAEIEADKAAEEAAKKQQEVTEVVAPSIFDGEQESAAVDMSFLGDEEAETAEAEYRDINIEELRALARSLTKGANADANGKAITSILGKHAAKTFPELKGDLKAHWAVYKEMSALTVG